MKLFSTFVAGNCRKTAQVEELITSTFIHMKHKILLLFIAIQTIAFGQQSMEFFFDKTMQRFRVLKNFSNKRMEQDI